MPEYKLDFSGVVELTDYSCIDDYIGLINNNDKLTICIENSDHEDAEIITDMLKRKKFSILEKGEKIDGKYYIKASRNK